MNKRLKLQCWNCPKTYFETLEITDRQQIIIKCPYCKADAIVNLKPYSKQSRTTTVYRGKNKDNQGGEDFQFPDIVPTRKPE